MTLILALLVQAESFEGLFKQERGTVWIYRKGESTVSWTLLSQGPGRLTFDEKEERGGEADPRAVTVVLAVADGFLTLERTVDQAAPSIVRLLKLGSKEGDAWDGGRRLPDDGKTIRVRVGEEEVALSPDAGITTGLVRVERPRFVPVSLAARYNATLTKAWHPSQVAEGEFNDLSSLPRGVQPMDGVPFDVRGVLQLASQMARAFPEKAEALQVRSEAARLHFLHATGWAAPPGTQVGTFTVRFKGGSREEIPILFGEDVSDWWQYPRNRFAGKRGKVAWVGSNPACRALGGVLKLYRTAWENPKPDVEIESVDYASTMTPAAPFLVGLTVERK